MEGCGAVQRAADGADVVEAVRWQQVAAWLSGWAWRRVCRPAWGLERSCRRVLPHSPLACPVGPGLAVSPAGLEHAWSCCRRVIDPGTLLSAHHGRIHAGDDGATSECLVVRNDPRLKCGLPASRGRRLNSVLGVPSRAVPGRVPSMDRSVAVGPRHFPQIPQAAVLGLIEGACSGFAGPVATLRMATGRNRRGVELKFSPTPLVCVTQCCERSAICSAFVSGMPGWCRTPPWKVLI